MSCRAVRGWLHRDGSSLDEAERLVLEDHVAACERCRGDRERMRALHRIATSLPVPPAGAREYSRAIARALLEDRDASGGAERSRRWPVVIAGLAAAAAVAIFVGVQGGRPGGERGEVAVSPRAPAAPNSPAAVPLSPREEPPTPTSTSTPISPVTASIPPAVVTPIPAPGAVPLGPATPGSVDVVESGVLVHRGAAIARGAAIPANVALRATAPARLALAQVHVVVAASSEIRWLPAERSVILERGTLDVDTAGAGPARVVTERFAVEVDDAVLTVDPAAVRVHRGAARIVDRAHTLVARLDAGGAWRLAEPVVKAPAAHAAPASASDLAVKAAHAAHAAPVSAADLLVRARAQLAARDYAAAERTATEALAATPSRRDEAEARVLLADVAQASGALDLASTRYLAVATSFADLAAAESALYAAARIELRRSRAEPARALLDRYLAHYPAGRYADDARRERHTLP